MTSHLSDKVALITGGSRGIGAAIVRRLARDGAAVAFTYAASEAKALALAQEIADAGGQALPILADSADPAQVRAAVDRTVADLGGLDILVNNAGIIVRSQVEDFDLAEMDRIYAINVRAVFAAVQAASPHLKAGGRIINTGSVVAERSGFPQSAIYSMSKGAVAAMTRGLARDFGPRGITVNAIQPGPTKTDMNNHDGVEDMLSPLMALGRLGEDHEVANLAAWLAGPESSFVTGANLTIDGGYLA